MGDLLCEKLGLACRATPIAREANREDWRKAFMVGMFACENV